MKKKLCVLLSALIIIMTFSFTLNVNAYELQTQKNNIESRVPIVAPAILYGLGALLTLMMGGVIIYDQAMAYDMMDNYIDGKGQEWVKVGDEWVLSIGNIDNTEVVENLPKESVSRNVPINFPIVHSNFSQLLGYEFMPYTQLVSLTNNSYSQSYMYVEANGKTYQTQFSSKMNLNSKFGLILSETGSYPNYNASIGFYGAYGSGVQTDVILDYKMSFDNIVNLSNLKIWFSDGVQFANTITIPYDLDYTKDWSQELFEDKYKDTVIRLPGTITQEDIDNIDWSKPAQDIIDGLGGVIDKDTVVVPPVDTTIPGLLGKVIDLIGSIFGTLGEILSNIISIPLGIIQGLLSGLWDIISYLLGLISDFITMLINAIKDLLLYLFVPSDTYWTNNFNNLKDILYTKLPIDQYTKIFGDSYTSGQIQDIYINMFGQKIPIVKLSVFQTYLPTIHELMRGLMFALLCIYNYNQTYKLIRGTSYIGEGDKKVGGTK